MDRPRRSTRPPAKAPQLLTAFLPRVIKRKAPITGASAPVADPAAQLKTLLGSSKSELVSVELSDIINSKTWAMLSDGAREHLKTFLPPTAFVGYRETLGSDHPSLEDSMIVDEHGSGHNGDQQAEKKVLNHAFFNDAHFLAAARTFQDHLYLNWFTDAHIEKVKQFQQGIRDGSLAAPWKDEVWEKEHPVLVPEPEPSLLSTTTKDVRKEPSFNIPFESSAKAGGASEIKLYVLAKEGIIRVGDVIAYKRSFASSEVVEKDSIIQSIHPSTYALTVLTSPGSTKDLPAYLLSPEPSSFEAPSDSDPSQSPRTMTITSPTMLETGLLDIDGRMDRSRRPNGNAWKCFSIWRWRGGGDGFGMPEGYNPEDSRGGRDNHGTLFYLRGSYYHER